MSDLHVFAIVAVAVLVVSGVGLWTAIRLVDEPIYVGRLSHHEKNATQTYACSLERSSGTYGPVPELG
jgi:hypothetical protein